jgi:hypothetical protein
MTEQGERPDRSLRRWPLVLLAALAAVSLLLHAVKWHRQAEVQGLCNQWAALAAARPIEGIKAQRARFYEIQYYLGYSTAISYAAADLSRLLVRVFQPHQVLSLQVDPGVRDLRFELAVGIAADDGRPGIALRKFAGLYEKLRNFPDISDLSFTQNDPVAGGRLHVFTVTGLAERP